MTNLLRMSDFYTKRSNVHGIGVFAAKDLQEDDIIYLPYIKLLRRNIGEDHPFKEYIFNLSKDYCALMGEFGEFINHSSKANIIACYTPSDNDTMQCFRILRNIQKDEEIFLNYGTWADKKWSR